MTIIDRGQNIKIERLELGPWKTNAYIIVCLKTGSSVIIDAPAEANTIIRSLKGTSPKYLLLTHNHFDHTGALAELISKLNIPLAVHEADADGLSSPPEILLKDGDVVSFGEVMIEVIHTPGHTPGSLSFRTSQYLFSGDTIFPGGPGRTETPAAFKKIFNTISKKIMTLPDNTKIYPGHGDSTVLEKERKEFAAFSSRPHDPGLCGDVLWLSS